MPKTEPRGLRTSAAEPAPSTSAHTVAPTACSSKPRRQCAKCPWKTSTDPHDIPNGYDVAKHEGLRETIAEPGALRVGSLRLMACHETGGSSGEMPCVGWLAHQLGPGNNLGLRLAVMHGRVEARFELDGPQHERFEDTLPKRRRFRRKAASVEVPRG